jgi:hypothetical protein
LRNSRSVDQASGDRLSQAVVLINLGELESRNNQRGAGPRALNYV